MDYMDYQYFISYFCSIYGNIHPHLTMNMQLAQHTQIKLYSAKPYSAHSVTTKSNVTALAYSPTKTSTP